MNVVNVRSGVFPILLHLLALLLDPADLVLNLLTKTRVEHVKRHPVALLCARDCDQPFVAVVLRLVDLNHTTADLAYFVDLLPALSDDGANHIVGDVDLLGQRRARHGSSVNGLSRVSAVRLRHGSTGVGLHRSSGAIAASLRCTVVNRHGRVGLGCLVRVRLRAVRSSWQAVMLGASVVSAVVVITVTVVASGWLWAVRDDLHAARDNASRATTPCRIRGGSRAAEPVVQLL